MRDVIVLNNPIFDAGAKADKIKLIMVRKMNYLPIQFTIQNSLFFRSEILSTDLESNIIDTLSTNCKIIIQIFNITIGVFVKKSLDGVLVSISNKSDIIEISGPTGNLNRALRVI